MLSQLFSVGVSALLATSIQAGIIQNKPRDGVIALDMQMDYSQSDLSKRQVGEHDYFIKGNNWPKVILPIGSNKDEVLLTVDTGSWLTQVPDVSTDCTECLLPNGKLGLYDANKSTTAVKTGQTLKSTFSSTAYYYGQGVIDDIWFDPNFKIPGTLFNDVHDIGSSWPYGILGLSKPPKGSENENIVWNAYKAGLINKPIVAITQKNESGNSLQLFLGGYSKSQLVEDYTWTSIENKNFAAHVDFVNINGTEVKINQTITFDTGNYYVGVSKEVHDGLLASFPDDPNNAKGSGKIDYNLIKDKTITVSIYGKNYNVPLIAFIEPDCTSQHCQIIIYTYDWNWGTGFTRFLNLALNYDNGSYIGIAGWKPSNTNDVVAF
ncbi:uncharacterized protein KGF55_001541 [Candida pseudojiufengensis]|uniref:uncharacterized protein n=1 Tax=Candida pseudojiufengensis TaxID=497109 RepID=UPI002225A10A|nr:uncharacterized protein KGF55_001541 [Candida pseudojiufengensis]KAI5965320.1 hypothetical protein KGF55_001541 [Candida pseudojiufengensis]